MVRTHPHSALDHPGTQKAEWRETRLGVGRGLIGTSRVRQPTPFLPPGFCAVGMGCGQGSGLQAWPVPRVPTLLAPGARRELAAL